MARTPSGYRLTLAAEADLEAIYAYTVGRWSIQQANRYLDDIEEAFAGLADGRKVGRKRPDLGVGYLSMAIGSHVAIYREIDAILVVRILHTAMDAPRHLG